MYRIIIHSYTLSIGLFKQSGELERMCTVERTILPGLVSVRKKTLANQENQSRIQYHFSISFKPNLFMLNLHNLYICI